MKNSTNYSQRKLRIEKILREKARRSLLSFVTYNYPDYDINWHHQVLASKLEAIQRGELKKLAVFMPPRHGKSELTSLQFPAWILGKKPQTKIIMSSYNDNLATDFGRRTRNLVDTQEYRNVFDIRLAQDSTSAGRWNTDKGGYYVSVGIGGAATGKGADCFVAGTFINTLDGLIPIEDIQYGERVLSYNHETNTVEQQRVVATRRIRKNGLITITTASGNSFTCTSDHRIFVDGQGYVEVSRLKQGDEVCSIVDASDTRVYFMRKGIQKNMGGVHQTNPSWKERHVLLSKMFKDTSFVQKLKEVRDMLKDNKTKDRKAFLLKTMQAIAKKTVEDKLQLVFKGNTAYIPYNKILQYGLQEQSSFSKLSGKEKSKLEARNVFRRISKRFLQDAEDYITEGFKYVYSLFVYDTIDYSSQEPKPERQSPRKLSNSLFKLPFKTPRVKKDTISSITFVEKEDYVYDIQVEDNYNFFANGVLVHNCLIIDDPHKNRKEAESPVKRKEVLEWYRSTAKTRLSPEGAVILVLTRWHDADLAGEILDDTWDIVEFKAIAEEDEDYRKKGEALWPSKFSLKWLEQQKKDIGTFEFSSLYQQTPLDSETVEFKKTYFKSVSLEAVLAKHTDRFLTIDTAISKEASADSTGFIINFVDTDQKWNVMAIKKKIDASELVKEIFSLHEKWKFTRIGIESTILYQAVYPFLVEEQQKRNVYLPLTAVKHNGIAKEIRIRGLLPRYESGGIFHIENECNDLENELIRFPKSTHDDLSDSLAYQAQIVTHVSRPNTYYEDVREEMLVDKRTGYVK